MNIYERNGLRKVINASGKMTILGVSAPTDNVANAVKEALQNYVVIENLIDYAGEIIAKKTGAEGGCPSLSAASGIAIMIASVVAGDNINHIERLPDSTGLKNEIIIQKGHMVNFGGNIGQMIRLGGGVPIEVGAANKVTKDHVKTAINENTVALFYVVSHHAVQKGMLSLKEMVEIGNEYDLPIIVDAAAEEDLNKFIDQGASLVVYSATKAMSANTSGLIAGKKDLIRKCKAQYVGIGRAMKTSKESMMGLITALNEYDSIPDTAMEEKEQMMELCMELNKIDGLECNIQKDPTREIYRANIKVLPEAKLTAVEIRDKLKAGNPAIFFRDHMAEQGELAVDPRPLMEGDDKLIIEEIRKNLE